MSQKSKDPRVVLETVIKEADSKLLKDMVKLMNRIERILIPSSSITYNPLTEKLANLMTTVRQGSYLRDVKEFQVENILNVLSANSELVLRSVDWRAFEEDLCRLLQENKSSEEVLEDGAMTVSVTLPREVKQEIDVEVRLHNEKMAKAMKKEKLRQLQFRNNQPVFPAKWRKEPFPPREYIKLTEYEVTDAVDVDEAKDLLSQLNTPLDGYLGQAYNYDDHGLTEEWMLTFRDKKSLKATDNEVIRTQLSSLLEIMMVQVQDRVCTSERVLNNPPLQLGVDIKEVPVWGIDCYTRTMIELNINDRAPKRLVHASAVKNFIERVLLPSINAQDPKEAHDMTVALKAIVVSSQPRAFSAERDIIFAQCVLDTIDEIGIENFRIHPKGTGVICIRPEGIPAHVFVTEYLGEVYPPYRWCERLDVIEQAQKRFELKPTLPDFYNILLERPRQDPRGYGLLYVDASQKANVGSSCSHSCDANCTSAVVARNGKLTIALTTNRHVYYGEELCMDYYSITSSDVEWRAAICLCGMTSCRGSFLHFATQDDLQQVLNQNFGPGLRYASLLRACSDLPTSQSDLDIMARHGIQQVALGHNPPAWMHKYISDILRFIEFERKALPCALLRDQRDLSYSFAGADMDARCVMEQRIQSMVSCISMVNRVLVSQPLESDEQVKSKTLYPLQAFTVADAVRLVWAKLQRIPELLTTHLISKSKDGEIDIQETFNKIEEILVQSPPPGFNGLRERCLEIRQALLSIEKTYLGKARLGQLADVLLLYAFTTNFSRPRLYNAVKSGMITVNARELGTNIARSKLYKVVTDHRKPLRSRNQATQNPKNQSSSEELTIAEASTNNDMSVEEETIDIETPGIQDHLGNGYWHEDSEDASMEVDTTTESVEIVEAASLNLQTVHYNEAVPAVAEVEAEGEEDNVSAHTDIATSDHSEEKESFALPLLEHGDDVPQKEENKPKASIFLSPNEPVYQGQMVYSPLFCFWQLIGWFNAATDNKVDEPDLFGCVLLPSIESCFGPSEVAYGSEQRKLLVEILRDEKLQVMPWPAVLKKSFNLQAMSADKDEVIYGSPMLDTALGQVDAVRKVLHHLQTAINGEKNADGCLTGSKFSVKEFKKSKAKKGSSDDDAMQLDDILPPEKPTSWVQCEDCKKWRRVPWHVDVSSLSDNWTCTMNTWDPEGATCEAPQDSYDPATESTVDYGGGVKAESDAKVEDFKVGSWRDVYCVRNKVYYEAQVKKIKKPTNKKNKPSILFHYRGWSPKFDEWVPFDSERIVPHHLFTNPDTTDPRAQEIWQGKEPVQALVRTAFHPSKKEGSGGSASKKRKSGDLTEPNASDKSPRK